ncbi:hypothetical protein CMK18_22580 [Candidatus Poribacteria bacterium]|nr:hypothetical protein [Candidatus Poribacteria bacterium]
MAIAPGRYDMTIQRRSDHSVDVTLKDSEGSAVNLQGYSIASQIWDKEREIKAADATCVITSATNGTFTWTVTDTQTSNFYLDEYQYDVQLTDGAGLKEYWIEGTIFMSQGYTA